MDGFTRILKEDFPGHRGRPKKRGGSLPRDAGSPSKPIYMGVISAYRKDGDWYADTGDGFQKLSPRTAGRFELLYDKKQYTTSLAKAPEPRVAIAPKAEKKPRPKPPKFDPVPGWKTSNPPNQEGVKRFQSAPILRFLPKPHREGKNVVYNAPLGDRDAEETVNGLLKAVSKNHKGKPVAAMTGFDKTKVTVFPNLGAIPSDSPYSREMLRAYGNRIAVVDGKLVPPSDGWIRKEVGAQSRAYGR